MIKIKFDQDFHAPDGYVWKFTNNNGNMSMIRVRKSGNIKEFISPTLDEVKAYFKEEGYKEEVAERAYRHYSTANWHNSQGKPVRNWKQTMSTNWMKPENKIQESKGTSGDKFLF